MPSQYLQHQLALERLSNEAIPSHELGGLWKLAEVVIDNEAQSVALIKFFLRSQLDKAMMETHDFTIEDMLNGRIAGELRREAAAEIFERWNKILGYSAFHSFE